MQLVDWAGQTHQIPRYATAADYRRLRDDLPFRVEWWTIEPSRRPLVAQSLGCDPAKIAASVGRVRAMAGGTIRHADIVSNLSSLLWNGRSDCHTRSENLAVAAIGRPSSFYPDVVVTCGPDQTLPDDPRTVTDPTLVIEVLSPTTERADRTTKFDAYTAMPSLREYVLVSQDAPRVERFVRVGNDWVVRPVTGHEAHEAAVEFESLGISVPMAAIYRNVAMDGQSDDEAVSVRRRRHRRPRLWQGISRGRL